MPTVGKEDKREGDLEGKWKDRKSGKFLQILPKAFSWKSEPWLGSYIGHSSSPRKLAASSQGWALGQASQSSCIASVSPTCPYWVDTQHSHIWWPCVKVWSLEATLTLTSVFLQYIASFSFGPQQHFAQVLAMSTPHTPHPALGWARFC